MGQGPKGEPCLSWLIRGHAAFRVTATYPNARSLLVASERLARLGDPRPWDQVVFEPPAQSDLPLEAISRLKSLHPTLHVVILTEVEDSQYLIAAIQAGVDSYILRTDPPGEINDLLSLTTKGGAAISPRIAAVLLKLIRVNERQTVKSTHTEHVLTHRQFEVLRALAEGDSYRDIGERLGVSLDTVRTHVRRVYATLQVRCAAQAVSLALSRGLL